MRCGGLLVACLGLIALSACHKGKGSDIGPRLRDLAGGDYKVMVRDNAGRAVSSARITVVGTSAVATTGASGRAILRGVTVADRVLSVDGTYAAATNVDELAQLSVPADPAIRNELPYTVYLPDLSASSRLPVLAGVQPGGSVLDDSSSSGAILSVSTGDTVAAGNDNSIVVTTGRLSPEHVPPGLPDVGGARRYPGSAVFVSPANLTLQNGASLSMPNDLGLPTSGTAALFRLNQTTGKWTEVARGAESAGRIVAPAGAVTAGGLYCFATTGDGTTKVSGRVVDAGGVPVRGALVRAPEGSIRTDANGRFSLSIITRDSGGATRNIVLAVDAGRDWLPVRLTEAVAATSADQDLGDLVLQTEPVSNLRVLVVTRGSRDPFREVRVGSIDEPIAFRAITNRDAEVEFENVGAGFTGYLSGELIDADQFHRTLGFLEVRPGLDESSQVFGIRRDWLTPGGNGTRVRVLGAKGGGGIQGAFVVSGNVPGLGRQGDTDRFGFSGGVPPRGQVTAVHQSSLDGQTVTSALSMVLVDTGEIFMPVRRALRQPGAAYPRFATVAGSIIGGAGGSTVRRLRASGLLTQQVWFEERFLGQAVTPAGPRKVDPEVTGGVTYQVGVPGDNAQVTVAEGSETGGVFSLARFGGAYNLSVRPGELTSQDLELAQVADQQFDVLSGVLGLDSSIAVGDLTFDLAAILSNGLVAEIARRVGGNHAQAGSSLRLTLPAVPASVSRYLVALRGASSSAGRSVEQVSWIELDGKTVPDVALLPAPSIASPSPGGSVSADGFSVQFTPPTGIAYQVLELRSTNTADDREWKVILPPTATSFQFMQLPKDVADPVIAGRTWTLKLTAARIDRGVLLNNPKYSQELSYIRMLSAWPFVTEVQRGVGAVSSTSITVTTN